MTNVNNDVLMPLFCHLFLDKLGQPVYRISMTSDDRRPSQAGGEPKAGCSVVQYLIPEWQGLTFTNLVSKETHKAEFVSL